MTGPALIHFWASAYWLVPPPVGVVLRAAAIAVLAIGLAVAQVTYLDRVAIRTGASS
jgi:hypothetical protein